MTEENVTTTDPQALAGTNVAGDGQQPGGDVRTYTNAEVEAIIQDRLRRQKAQFSDYGDLKAKADRLAELEQAQMTELEQAQAKPLTPQQRPSIHWEATCHLATLMPVPRLPCRHCPVKSHLT